MSDALISSLITGMTNTWLVAIIISLILAAIFHNTKSYWALIFILILIGLSIYKTIKNKKLMANPIQIVATIIDYPTSGKSANGWKYEFYYNGNRHTATMGRGYHMKIGKKFTIFVEAGDPSNTIIDLDTPPK